MRGTGLRHPPPPPNRNPDLLTCPPKTRGLFGIAAWGCGLQIVRFFWRTTRPGVQAPGLRRVAWCGPRAVRFCGRRSTSAQRSLVGLSTGHVPQGGVSYRRSGGLPSRARRPQALRTQSSLARGQQGAEGSLRAEIRTARARIEKLRAKRNALLERVEVGDALKGQKVVRLSKEREHLTNVLKMGAYQIETDLLENLGPHALPPARRRGSHLGPDGPPGLGFDRSHRDGAPRDPCTLELTAPKQGCRRPLRGTEPDPDAIPGDPGRHALPGG
jgi:hypothetical protein